MGENGTSTGDEKDAASSTKRKFRGVWSDIHEASKEHWLLSLRDSANLIGMCVYPVGWAWIEYDLQMREKPARWEKRAKTVCSMGNLLDEPVREGGKTAFQNGINFRRARIERLLMRMVKRKEVSVIIYDHRLQGYEIDNRMRLRPPDLALVNDYLSAHIEVADKKHPPPIPPVVTYLGHWTDRLTIDHRIRPIVISINPTNSTAPFTSSPVATLAGCHVGAFWGD